MEITAEAGSHALGRASRALLLAALLMAVAFGAHAQPAPAPASQAGDDEPLAEKVIDPVAYLTQIQIKDPYTPAQYGTNAQPNTVQLRAILALRPFLFIPFDQLV